MHRTVSTTELPLRNFKELLKDDQFLDFFNKFTTLPVFGQLIVCNKNLKFTLEPEFNQEHNNVSNGDILDWLWRKRCCRFVKTRFYIQYKLANRIVSHQLHRNDIKDLENYDEAVVHDSLVWLMKKYFGRVSAFRRFRQFLSHNQDGFRLYLFWVYTERMFQYFERESPASLRKFKQLREIFFVRNGELKFSDRLLHSVKRKILKSYPLPHSSKRNRFHGIVFTLQLQEHCIDRICSYWVPRFLLATKFQDRNAEERGYYEVAMQYLLGSLDRSIEVLQSDPDFRQSFEKLSNEISDLKLQISKFEMLSSQLEFQESFMNEVDDEENKQTNGEITDNVPPTPRKRVTFEGNLQDIYLEKRVCNMSMEEKGWFYEKSLQNSFLKKQKRYGTTRWEPTNGQIKTLAKKITTMSDADLEDMETMESTLNLHPKFDNAEDIISEAERKDASIQKTTSVVEKEVDKVNDDTKEEVALNKEGEEHEIEDIEIDLYEKPLSAFDFNREAPDSCQIDSLMKGMSESSKMVTHQTRISLPSMFQSGPFIDNSTFEMQKNFHAYVRMMEKKRRFVQKSRLLRERRQVTTLSFTLATQTEETRKYKAYWRLLLDKQKKVAQAAAKAKKEVLRENRKKAIDSNKIMSPGKPSKTRNIIEEKYSWEEEFKVRSEPQVRRLVAALQIDHAAGNPFHQYLKKCGGGVSNLRFWQDAETCRLDYQFGSMEFSEFTKTLKTIIANYLQPDSPYAVECPETLKKQIEQQILSGELHEMPWELRNLQAIVIEDLKNRFESFLEQDVLTFQSNVKKTFESKSSLARMPARPINVFNTRKPSKLSRKVLLRPISSSGDYVMEDDSIKGRHHEQSLKDGMEKRMFRAQKIILETHLPSGRVPVFKEDIHDSDSSDDEGWVKSPPPPKKVLTKPPNMKELAAMALREYPNANQKYVTIRSIAKTPDYKPPGFFKVFKRKEYSAKRPLSRPGNINETLKDPVHFETFRRFLKNYHMEGPLSFWLAIENMRRATNSKVRQLRAQSIIKRFFRNIHRPADAYLQCNAEVIREISRSDIVSTALLVQAQTAVAKALENNWFRRYASTFPDVSPRSVSNAASYSPAKATITTQRTKRAWEAFYRFIRRTAMFIRHMKQDKFVKLFANFLKLQAEDFEEEPSPTAAAGNTKLENSPTLNTTPNRSRHETPKKGQRHGYANEKWINYSFLENDLHFWKEIECYKRVAEYCTSVEDILKNKKSEEWKLLKRKAQLVVKCYMDSSIQPELRVNVSHEVRDNVLNALQSGLINGTLFHRVVLDMLPTLLMFWKKFCEEHYKYSPVLGPKFKRIYGLKHSPAIAAAMKEEKKKKRMKKKKSKSNAEDENPAEKFPDYLDLTPNKFRTVKGQSFMLSEEVQSKLLFSISRGVSIIQPPSPTKEQTKPHPAPTITPAATSGKVESVGTEVRFAIGSNSSALSKSSQIKFSKQLATRVSEKFKPIEEII